MNIVFLIIGIEIILQILIISFWLGEWFPYWVAFLALHFFVALFLFAVFLISYAVSPQEIQELFRSLK